MVLQLNFGIGSRKSAWEKGEVGTAEGGEVDADRRAELEELRAVSVKTRFPERGDDDPDAAQRKSHVPEDIANCKPYLASLLLPLHCHRYLLALPCRVLHD